MLREHAQRYYQADYNCAESILLAANEQYSLGIPDEMLPLVGGFGGGMGCRGTCGALTGGIAALGKLHIRGRAHLSPKARECCAALVAQFTDTLGSVNCQTLMDLHRGNAPNCLNVVLMAADVLEAIMDAG